MPIESIMIAADNESCNDYILYEILCDYCDEEYTIKYMINDRPKQSIECCPFCSNLIEEPVESMDELNIDDEETGWG